eukprot:685649-Pyramimonas_sp.AAC.1
MRGLVLGKLELGEEELANPPKQSRSLWTHRLAICPDASLPRFEKEKITCQAGQTVITGWEGRRNFFHRRKLLGAVEGGVEMYIVPLEIPHRSLKQGREQTARDVLADLHIREEGKEGDGYADIVATSMLALTKGTVARVRDGIAPKGLDTCFSYMCSCARNIACDLMRKQNLRVRLLKRIG